MKRLICIIISFLFLSSVFAGSLDKDMISQAKEYRDKGYKLQSIGNMEEALSYYQKAAQIYPEYKEVFNDMGVVYEAMGDKKEALAMYKKALELDSNYLPAYTNLALFYESQGNIEKAAKYWYERYRRGKRGEYWREEAKKKLLKLGVYPEIHREMLEEKAADLSKNIAYKREQERLKDIDEANLHFEAGKKFFRNGDYTDAIKELQAAIYMSSSDKDLQMRIASMYALVKDVYAKQKVKHYITNALNDIDDNDYVAAKEKIKKAANLIPCFSK